MLPTAPPALRVRANSRPHALSALSDVGRHTGVQLRKQPPARLGSSQ